LEYMCSEFESYEYSQRCWSFIGKAIHEIHFVSPFH
jgi:hypothetical protein